MEAPAAPAPARVRSLTPRNILQAGRNRSKGAQKPPGTYRFGSDNHRFNQNTFAERERNRRDARGRCRSDPYDTLGTGARAR